MSLKEKLRTWTAVTVFVLTAISSAAQTDCAATDADLRTALSRAYDPQARLEAATALAAEYEEPDSTDKFATIQLRLSRSLGVAESEANALRMLAKADYRRKNKRKR